MARIGDIVRITKLRSAPDKKTKAKGRDKPMTAPDNREPTTTRSGLTPEQLAVVDLPPEARALVTAGPGTGKTHVLIARLSALVDKHGLQPGRELLVLSFSRAAVGEIRRRVKATGGDVAYTRTYTFDSFASKILLHVDAGGSWSDSKFDYDDRIRAATEKIKTNPEAKALLAGYAHVLVDEIQDLVEPRAGFVTAILEASGGGFTLLGDPAQSIYNFQLRDPDSRRRGSQALYSYIGRRYTSSLRHFRLTENHRVQSPAASVALTLGAALNQPEPNYRAIAQELESIVGHLPQLEKPTDALRRLAADGRSTAVLCRTNSQALVISRELAEAGIAHVYRCSATDRILPTWPGIVFGDWNYGQIGKGAFVDLLGEKLNGQGPDPDESWSLLKRMEGQPGKSLDITLINARIVSGNVPDELNAVPSGMLTVSTIHRAKGLEFDRVILVEPTEAFTAKPIEFAEEIRTLYVALTRPKHELLKMPPPNISNMKQLGYDNRWVRQYRGWQLTAVEVKGQDVHSQDPAGGYLLKGIRPADTQTYLRDVVKPGDPVALRRFTQSVSGTPRAFYTVEHNRVPIGITSERFADVLRSIIKVNPYWQVQWPIAVEGLRVEAVDTVAGTVAAGQNAGLNGTGLWLRARVIGLGNTKWEHRA